MEENFGKQNCHYFIRSSARNKFFSQNEGITSVETADVGGLNGTELHSKWQRNITNVIEDKYDDGGNKKRARFEEFVQLNVGWKCDSFLMVEGFNRDERCDKEPAVRAKGMVALATASSGVAAALLHGGRTAHSRFKIPLQIKTIIEETVDSSNIDRRIENLA